MRVGQTSLIAFVSKLLASVLGFVATLYFANVLGAEILGVYAVTLSFVAWLRLGGRLGVDNATTKRISEDQAPGAYLTAGAVLVGFLTLSLALITVIGHEYVEAYVEDFEKYTSLSVVWFVVGIFVFESATSVLNSALKGQDSVHIFALLRPLKIGLRSLIQIGLVVFLGWQILGLLVGYIGAVAIILVVGILFVRIRPRMPEREHVRSLLDYAKFSWLGGLKTRAFNDVDILILGALVPTNLVGVYSIVWSLTKVLDLFSTAINDSMFPTISNVATEEGPEATTKYIEDATRYGGFLTLPGTVGGLVLADRLFMLYGSEFSIGTEVFGWLLVSILSFGYMRQFLNALNALDRPDLAFYANGVFIGTNICLNVVLIWQIGWVGAAIASAVSSSVGLVLSYHLLRTVVPFNFPVRVVGKQVGAALAMGGVVLLLQNFLHTTVLNEYNFVMVLALVAVGAGIYVLILLAVSPSFRAIVSRNLPDFVPYTA